MDAKIKVHDRTQYECKQSRFDHVPKLPSRGIFLAPSGVFKTVAIVSLLLDHYKGCFERIYVFSPSVDIDSAWAPVKEYVSTKLKVDLDKEQCFFHEFDHAALEKIVRDQHEMTLELKKRGSKRLYNIIIIVDDWSDDPAVLHNQGKNVLNTLFTRGRHQNISCWVSAQKLTTISTVIRTQTQSYCVGRLRSQKELQSFLEEISATYPIKTLLQMYNLATREPHSFLYVNLSANPPRFFINFEQEMAPRSSEEKSSLAK